MFDKKQPKDMSEAEWKETLTPEQFHVLRQKGTERAFTGPYCNTFELGTYSCAACSSKLFKSDTKFDAGCGWPSFFEAVAPDVVTEHKDVSHGMARTEICCTSCGGHLGHVFPDGPPPTGLRYCMNGTSMIFTPDE